MTRTRPYTVQRSDYDASHPFRVVATFRRFNRVVSYHATEQQAKAAAYRRNRITAIVMAEQPSEQQS